MTNGIICCACSISAISVLQFASETMAKRLQQDSGEERVAAKSRPMMSLIARVPSNVSSSASVSPGKRSYGNHTLRSTIAEKEERPGTRCRQRPKDRNLTTIIMNNLLKVFHQQASQSEMITMLGLLKSGKLILRCANDRGDPM